MDRSYFEGMYASDDDPWGFDTSQYERRKYDLTVAALTRSTYRTAFEPGCSNGALTERLAPRCNELVACDMIDDVVERARHRLARFDHVQIVNREFPSFWPDTALDLVVWSEVAYYLSDDTIRDALAGLDERLAESGELVVVSYSGATNYPQTADGVDAHIERSGLLRRHTALRSVDFRLDVWTRQPKRSSPL